MLKLHFAIVRGNHSIYFSIKGRRHIGFAIMLDKPFTDRWGNQYIWSISDVEAIKFVEALAHVKENEQLEFRVTTQGGNANMLIETRPIGGEWMILSITHWGATNHQRLFEGFEPNLTWIMKIREAELESIVEGMKYYFDLEEEPVNV
ncbi:hypothetical protein A2801_02020 [Candidatus Woesebacteria bacterium RIFCSPHIGHO2_01_FULL_41_10]|uniref:Uncharacterized protein n=1 Tax=Candidatus Woesebacteria bacterium RIFCSPHIGHO2_01_FULL_41_10 TaxID=1802500 RepID=A0A1F7YQ37_9BACT|nr:MAG: hypothetical protein A2801_02020 [Candidatus Woesebacteria bacterium RIFCSPHIGHO2_01_FULL_41_10]